MKIAHIFSAHLLPTDLISNSDGALVPGSPFQIYGGGSGNAVIYQRTSDDWICLRQPTSTATSTKSSLLRLILNLLNVFPDLNDEDCIYIGSRFRYRTSNTPSGSGGTLFAPWSFCGVFAIDDPVIRLNTSQAQNFSGLTEYYFEVALDFKAQTVSYWIDGNRVSTTPMGPNLAARTGVSIQLGNVVGSPNTQFRNGVWFDLRDIYVGRSEGVNDRQRLGPQRIVRIPASAVSGDEWSASNGAARESVINRQPTNAASVYTPYLAGTDTAGKLEIDLNVTPFSRINAVAVTAAGRKLNGTEPGFNVCFKQGELEGEKTPFNFTQNNQVANVLIDHLAPDGMGWSNEKMENLKIIFDPN